MINPKDALIRSVGRLSGFMRDRCGSVAIMFGLTIFPVVCLVGVALDYSRASDLRAQLQRATDATGIQLCQLPNTMTRDEYFTKANNALLPSYLGPQKFAITELSVTQNPHRIKLATAAVYDTAVVRILGTKFATIDLDAEAQCENQEETFEIALVLDNTGSMAQSSGSQSKMDALKTAAKNFVEFVYKTPRLAKTKISIVPFAVTVKLDPIQYRNASWIDQTGKASYHWNILRKEDAPLAKVYAPNGRFTAFSLLSNYVPSWDWGGCFESLPYPLNVNDGVPDPAVPDSYYVPMLAPDESGPGGTSQHPNAVTGAIVRTDNDYLSDTPTSTCGSPPATDELVRTGQGCKYLAPTNVSPKNNWGPNRTCTGRALTRLTDNKTTLLNEISQMQPSGNTDIHEGAIWGWRTLAPSGQSVFGDGAAYDKPFNHKIMIVMTDGMNTWNANPGNPALMSVYSAYGFFKNPDGTGPNNRLPVANANPADDTKTRAAIDALTLETCKNASATGTGKPNVVIYTIAFSVPSAPIDAQGINLLKTCAGDPKRAFVANDSQGIIDVFQKIGENIAGLKLTQ